MQPVISYGNLKPLVSRCVFWIWRKFRKMLLAPEAAPVPITADAPAKAAPNIRCKLLAMSGNVLTEINFPRGEPWKEVAPHDRLCTGLKIPNFELVMDGNIVYPSWLLVPGPKAAMPSFGPGCARTAEETAKSAKKHAGERRKLLRKALPCQPGRRTPAVPGGWRKLWSGRALFWAACAFSSGLRALELLQADPGRFTGKTSVLTEVLFFTA